MNEKTIPLSKRTKAILLGSLLGDGSLRIHPRYQNARFSFRHSIKQKEYFFWKVNQLKEISGPKSFWLQGRKGHDGWGTKKWRYQSKALASLTQLYDLTCKKDRKQIRRKWLNQLLPLSLAIWWLDDGSLVSDSRQGVLCTDSFSEKEVEILAKYLKNVWQIKTSLGQVGETGRFRLWIRSTENLQKFLRLILPHIEVEQMLSKIIMLYKDQNLQQRWISEIANLSKFPLDIINKYLNAKRTKWRNFRK